MEMIIMIILQSFLYFIIPLIPAVIIRVRFPKTAPWIAVIPTVIGGLCLIISLICIFLSDDILSSANMFFSYAVFCVPCSLPGLYCVAFYNDNKKLWLSLLPPVIFFAYWFARYWIISDNGFNGFTEAVDYLIIGVDEDIIITYTTVGYGVWALICVLGTTAAVKYGELKKL